MAGCQSPLQPSDEVRSLLNRPQETQLVGFSPTEPEDLVRTTRQLSITLPNEMADQLRQRVASGDYASESEVIRDGLRTLFARDQMLESWMRDEVVRTYDALAADPSATVTVQDVRARLAGKRPRSL
jgi:antitoxin ParD1/3/4